MTERRLAATITVRLTPEEAEALRWAAKARGMTYSAVVRAAVAALAARPVVTVSGATVLARTTTSRGGEG